MCHGGDFACHDGIVGKPISGEKLEDEKASSWSIQALPACPWQMLNWTQMIPSVFIYTTRLSDWMANVGFMEEKEVMNIVETIEILGTERQDQQEDHVGACEKLKSFWLACIFNYQTIFFYSSRAPKPYACNIP